jgi:hypothetical protein
MAVPHVWRAGRPFPTGAYREVEVLDQDEDPPEVENEVPNFSSPGTNRKVKVADPDRMGRLSYARICADGRFSVKETGGVDATISAAAVVAARKEVTRLSEDLTSANIKIGELEATVAQLRGQLSAVGEKAKADQVAEAAKADQVDDRVKAKKGR